MIDNLKDLEKRLEEVEKESAEADWEWGFTDTLKEYHGADEVINFIAAKKIIDEEKQSNFCLKTKIPRLDTLIEGFREGNLVVITSPTGMGKTTISQTFTKNFSDEGVKSLWFTYEVPIRQFLSKYGTDIPSGGYVPKSIISNKLVWIERKIVEAIVKYDTKVVFIDHLHYLIELTGKNNSSLEIGATVRQIKQLAVKYNVIIFLIAHLTKTKFDAAITLDDIRDSSFIGQEADYVIILKRDLRKGKINQYSDSGEIEYSNTTRMSVGKNRFNGKLGSLTLEMVNGLFQELSTNIKDTKNYDTEDIEKESGILDL